MATLKYPASRTKGLEENKFPKGKSGNKNGRPVGALETPRAHALKLYQKTLSKDVRDLIKAKSGFKISSKTYAGAIVEIQMLVALVDQCTKAAKFVTDLTEAPLPRALQLTDADGESLGSKIIVMKYEDMPEEDVTK